MREPVTRTALAGGAGRCCFPTEHCSGLGMWSLIHISVLYFHNVAANSCNLHLRPASKLGQNQTLTTGGRHGLARIPPPRCLATQTLPRAAFLFFSGRTGDKLRSGRRPFAVASIRPTALDSEDTRSAVAESVRVT